MLSHLLSRFWWLITFALYLPIFFLPLPPRFESHGIEIADELFLIIGCTLIYFAFLRVGWLYRTISLSATLTIFTLPLLRVWETAASGQNLILGLLPFLDAGGYYSDALRLMAGKWFADEGVYRPLFSTFLATLLKLMNGNLQVAVTIFVIIFSLGVFSLAVEVNEAFGAEAGVALIGFLQFFYRQIAGAPMTEQLGVPIGAFGLALLIRAVRGRNKWFYLSGLFLLSSALLMRAGAYVVLPALMIFGLFQFTGKRKEVLVNGLLLFFAAAVPWGMEALVHRLVTPPGTVASANFAFTLYGQARGGWGWRAMYLDHPELLIMPKFEVGRVAYQYAFEEIKRNPFGLVQGLTRALVNFFTPAYLFNVFQVQNSNTNLILQILSFALFLAGLWFVWKQRTNPIYALLLAGFAGIVLSVPFLPPWDGGVWWGGIRVHSATLGFHLIVTGIGLSELTRMFRRSASPAPMRTYQSKNSFWILGLVVVFTAVIGAYFVKSTATTLRLESPSCAKSEIPVHFLLSPGSFIRVVDNDSGFETRVPIVLIKHVERSMSDFIYGDFAFIPRRINQRAVFTYTNDLTTGQSMWIIGPPEMADSTGKPITACGKRIEVPHNVIYITEFK